MHWSRPQPLSDFIVLNPGSIWNAYALSAIMSSEQDVYVTAAEDKASVKPEKAPQAAGA
jgi:hypothetical protein